MAENRPNTNVSNSKSRAEQRMEAFLGPRVTRNVRKQIQLSKSVQKSRVIEASTEIISPAEHRLQQLQLFRRKQQITELAPAASARRSGIFAKDLIVPGQLNWVPLGPLGVEKGQASTTPIVSGRVKSIAVAPGGQRVYVATANGGVWYSGDSGKTWRSLFDQFNFFPAPLGAVGDTDSLACGAIALVAGAGNSTDKIYVGTGEGDGMTDSYLGVGPLVSSDGGSSWVREPASPSLVGRGFYAMVVDPDDPERVLAGTSIGVFARIPDGTGGYKWDRKGLSGTRVTGLTVARGATGKCFYASVWTDTVYMSTDGDNWSAAGTNFPTNRIGRITVASHPTTPELAYALVAFAGPDPATVTDLDPKNGHLHGVYRLDTRIDNQWRPVSAGMPKNIFGSDRINKSGQGNYDNWIVVSPNNENRIFLAGSTVFVGGEWSAAVYRCNIQVQTAAGVTTVTGANDFLGASAHADVHTLTFTPNEPEQLWVGCDGGVYFTNQASGNGNIFQSLNAGLQTLTMNHFGMHPDEEDSFFCSAQDNGCLRYFGENIWLHSFAGDSGFCIINWKRRSEVLATYTNNIISFSNTYGNRPAGVGYTDTSRNVTLQQDAAGTTVEPVNFYAPMVGIPFKTGLPDPQADMVAFGTDRPWVSTDFGANWFPLPSRTASNLANYNSDSALLGNNLIDSLTFADSKNLLVGLSNGQIFKYTDTSAGNNWTTVGNPPTRLDNAPGSGGIPGSSVRDLVVNPSNSNQFYAVFGGIIGSHKHVWFFDGTNWNERSGTGADILLDVHFNTLVINPDNVNQIFAGCDIGMWKSEDGGSHWAPFSNGLPETAIIDLHISSRNLGGGGKLTLMRVATYGRGVFECNISAGVASTPAAELYLRDNVLDRGRFPTRQGVADPRNTPNNVPDLDTPDIKVDVPDASGKYQFAATETLSPGQFSQQLTDKSNQVPVSATGKIVSRVYVQVHSHGMQPANNVQVVLLIKELGGANLPDLPVNYDPDIRSGIPVNREGWQTVGIRLVQGVQAGQPKVVAFDLPSTMLPAHGTLGGSGKDLVLAALLHDPQIDEYTATAVVLNPATANNVAAAERKITARQIRAVQSAAIPDLAVRPPLAGYIAIPASATVPEAPYDAFLAQAFRLNDQLFNKLVLARFAQPFSNRGTDGVLTNPDTKSLVFADTITVDADIALQPGMPLMWFARRKITISKTINAKGLGAPRTGDGDFGGAGGGGASSAGKKCSLPRSIPAIDMATGGGIGNNAGANLDAAWATRALLQLPFCKGAGAGGDDGANPGGLGGGIVVLCAPVIEFSPTGKIDVTGANAPGNAGGGGGGLIVLIAGETVNLNNAGPNQNVLVAGGSSSGTGGAGGTGLLLRKTFQ